MGCRLGLHPNTKRITLEFFIIVASCLTSFCVYAADPIGLLPLFFVWPALFASYYLSRTKAVVQYVLMISTFGLAIYDKPEINKFAAFATVVLIITILMVLVGLVRAKLEELILALQKAAAFDSLTGAYNRAAFEEHLEKRSRASSQYEKPYALAIFDLDHFKKINDKLGHRGGDQALKDLVALVNSQLRVDDVFARIGGEEFGLMIPETSVAEAEAFCDQLRKSIAAHTAYKTPFTVSCGLVCADTQRPERVLAVADRALYKAKKLGRNRVQVDVFVDAGLEARFDARYMTRSPLQA